MSLVMEEVAAPFGTDTVRADAPPISADGESVGTNSPHDAKKMQLCDGFIADIKQWAFSGNRYWPGAATSSRMEPGLYVAMSHPQLGIILERKPVKVDSLIELPDDAGKAVLTEFDQFWQRRDAFAELGVLHKRGFLLWGPPGSGKTSTLAMMGRKIVENGGMVLYVDHPSIAMMALSVIRAIEPDRQLVVLMEDIDGLLQNYGQQGFLAMLDGEAHIDNVVFVATTNYPERLEARFANRPSRFDTVRYIGMSSAAARDAYLKHRAPQLSDADRASWVERTDGFSVAHLKELVIAHYCFGQPVDAAIARLEGMRHKLSSEQTPESPGFGFFGKR